MLWTSSGSRLEVASLFFHTIQRHTKICAQVGLGRRAESPTSPKALCSHLLQCLVTCLWRYHCTRVPAVPEAHRPLSPLSLGLFTFSLLALEVFLPLPHWGTLSQLLDFSKGRRTTDFSLLLLSAWQKIWMKKARDGLATCFGAVIPTTIIYLSTET